jgi:Spy/CpxP family protein refolding chaperone
MKKRIVVTAALAALAGTVWAAPGPDGKRLMAGGPDRPEALGARIIQRVLDNPEKMKELGISEEQAAKLQDSFYELEKKMVTLRSDAELAQIEVRRLMDAAVPDQAAVLAAVDKAGAARTAIQKAMVEQRLAVRGILGEETANKIKRMAGDRLRHARGAGYDEDRPRGPRGEGRGKGEDKGEGKGAPWMKEQMEPPGEE